MTITRLDNTCTSRIAITFDDGVSAYRPQTLAILREKQVHGVFYDNGFRVAANRHMAVFQVREGHTQLNHSYTHPHFNQSPTPPWSPRCSAPRICSGGSARR